MGLLQKLLRRSDRGTVPVLYRAVVERGRAPHWYATGAVPDTIDGRFDMIAAVLAVVLLRMESEPAGIAPSTVLAECFIEDMDGQLREIGIGDVLVGKHMGKMMGMLGGRLGAYRDGFAQNALEGALVRNLYRGDAPAPEALAHVEAALLAFRAALATTPLAAIVAGELPQ